MPWRICGDPLCGLSLRCERPAPHNGPPSHPEWKPLLRRQGQLRLGTLLGGGPFTAEQMEHGRIEQGNHLTEGMR